MIVEFATFVLTIVAAFAGVVAAFYARKEDRIRPKLGVSEERVIKPEESEEVSERMQAGLMRLPPTKVVRLVLDNSGQITAFGTVGEVYFDPPHVQAHQDILPRIGSAIIYQGVQGPPGVQLHADGNGFLVASGGRVIDIPVIQVSSGTMQVTYRFSAPSALPTRGAKTVEVSLAPWQ